VNPTCLALDDQTAASVLKALLQDRSRPPGTAQSQQKTRLNGLALTRLDYFSLQYLVQLAGQVELQDFAHLKSALHRYGLADLLADDREKVS
jgi:hypothetical protein